MPNLRNRIDDLEHKLGISGKPIFTCIMTPEYWNRVRLNPNTPVIIFQPEINDEDRDERLADIETLKKTIKSLAVISQGDGYAIWQDGKCIKDGGLLRLTEAV